MKTFKKEIESLQKSKSTLKLIDKFQEYIQATKEISENLNKRIKELQKTQESIKDIPALLPMFIKLQSHIEEGQNHSKLWQKNIVDKQNLLEELKAQTDLSANPTLAVKSQPSAVTSDRSFGLTINQSMFASNAANSVTHAEITGNNEVESATLVSSFKPN